MLETSINSWFTNSFNIFNLLSNSCFILAAVQCFPLQSLSRVLMKCLCSSFIRRLFIKRLYKFLSLYVGYRGWLPPSHPSVPSLIPLPHFRQTDRDRSGPDLDCSSSKRNWLCSPKHGETELEQIQKELGDLDLRPEPICFQPSPKIVFPSSHFSLPKVENQTP